MAGYELQLDCSESVSDPLSKDTDHSMWLIVSTLLTALVLAGQTAAFAAFPDRGEDIPHARWLSELIAKARDKTAR